MRKVVVIGHGYLSRLALIRSLGQGGYDVTVIVTMYGPLDTTRPLDCYSKYVSAIYYCNAKDSEGLIKILTKNCVSKGQKTVIIPDSDWAASIIDTNRHLLSDNFLFPYIKDGSSHLVDWMNKERQKELARDVGLWVPNVTKLSVVGGQIPDLSSIRFPCFTKALTTIFGGKQWFSRCNNADELNNTLKRIAQKGDADILVEDYIEIENEYAVVGISDGDNVVIPGVIQFVENCQRHLGIARKGKIVPATPFAALIEKFKAYVKSTRFVGLFDIDFLYSKGKFYFCEMNFRYGGSGYAYTKSKINLPACFVQMITEELDITQINESVTVERDYVNERMLVDDLEAGCISLREFKRAISTADIRFVPDIDDPVPQKLFKKIVLRAKIKNILKGILRR